MNQRERRERLIELLWQERGETPDVPESDDEQRMVLRGLLNQRPPVPASDELLALQDAYLQERLREVGAVDAAALPVAEHIGASEICLWQGDITRLAADAIANAANHQMLGCFLPGHHCIDNAIHTYAGLQLRLACQKVMQGREAETGEVIVTPGFNLPARLVLHVTGPVARSPVAPEDARSLACCYENLLDAAAENGCESVALCCLSTGVFGFPQQEAAEIAVATTRRWLKDHPQARLRVVFNTFLDSDQAIYEGLLGIDNRH